MSSVLALTFFGNTVLAYISAGAVLAIGIGFVFLAHRLLVRRLAKAAEKSSTKIDDMAVMLAGKTVLPALLFGVVYLSLSSLSLNPAIAKLMKVVGVVLFTFLSVRFITTVISFAIFQYWIPRQSNKGIMDQQFRGLLPAMYVLVWGVAIIFMLDNLGFKVSAVLAGLGIGGVALALASQAVLADLFSYFAILFDRPFVIGDFIIVGDQMGTVENIGIKTTRVRSLGGEQLVFGNKDLTANLIRNFKRMYERRVVFNIAIDYQTPTEQLREIPALLKQIVTEQSPLRFDRAHFVEFQPSGLRYEIVYIVLTDDFNKYMDIQQEINIRIKDEFQRRNIGFSHPLQTLQMKPAELATSQPFPAR